MAFFLALATVNGCANVISKMISFKSTKLLGRNNGSLINYVVGTLTSLVILLITSRLHIDFYSFSKAPWYLYLGGVFGIVAFVMSMATLSHLKVMESTILLLAGQLTGGIIFDSLTLGNINALKIFGILLVGCGVIWDNKVSQKSVD